MWGLNIFLLHETQEWISVSFEGNGVFAVSNCEATLQGFSAPPQAPSANQLKYISLMYVSVGSCSCFVLKLGSSAKTVLKEK